MTAAPRTPPVDESIKFPPASNGRADLAEFYDNLLLPRLSAELVYADPVHNWKRSGGKWRGACPWHQSGSGSSFNVTLDTLAWYCAGCGFGGGPVQYLYRREGGSGSPRGKDYVDVLRTLADLAGVTFPERELTDAERSVRRFIHKAAGYSATGSARERVVLIPYGSGRNGKGVLLQTLRTILGEYAVRVPSETFLARRQEGIPNDVAQLRGARLAFGSETGEGRRLAEAKIKDLTGGEDISARFMRGEWFSFVPTFTPWLATNHRPVIKGSDPAIWDRVRLIPFTVRFRLPDEPDDGLPLADLTLAEKLDAEQPGILAWIVRGAVSWYRDGLGTPEAVKTATAAYRADMDDLADFLANRCVVEPGASVGSRTLYEAYKGWSEGAGERPLSERMFSTRVEERSFAKRRITAGMVFLGLRLRTPMDAPEAHVGSGSMQHRVAFSGITGDVQNSHVETPEKATQPYIAADPTLPQSGDDRPCWSCRRELNAEIDDQCSACGWLRCPCGACGCRDDDGEDLA